MSECCELMQEHVNRECDGFYFDITTRELLDEPNSRCENEKWFHERWECPDVVIMKTLSGGYGLSIKDGGSSFYCIKFCPFCGAGLPEPGTPWEGEFRDLGEWKLKDE